MASRKRNKKKKKLWYLPVCQLPYAGNALMPTPVVANPCRVILEIQTQP